MNEQDAKVILAYAAHRMQASQAARACYMHRNSVRYILGKVKRKTGLDPDDFYDLYELTQLAARLLEQLEKRRAMAPKKET